MAVRDLVRKHWAFLGSALILLLYFGYFHIPRPGAGLLVDDPYNIHYFWSRGVPSLVKGVIFFFTTYYRPMGGVYFYTMKGSSRHADRFL